MHYWAWDRHGRSPHSGTAAHGSAGRRSPTGSGVPRDRRRPIVLGLLSVACTIATAVMWVMILVTGRYPEALYGFAIGVLSWSVRVEAYLLLRDEYAPFTLRA
jgi:hypothetical protein